MAEDAVTATAAQNETRIEFPDNRLLAELCGEFDRNLTTIETHHAIQIVRRGNLLLLVGDADGCGAGIRDFAIALYSGWNRGGL